MQSGHENGRKQQQVRKKETSDCLLLFSGTVPGSRRASARLSLCYRLLPFVLGFILSDLRPSASPRFPPLPPYAPYKIYVLRASHAPFVRCRSSFCVPPYLKLIRPGSHVLLFAVGIACNIKKRWICLTTAETNIFAH